MAIITRQPFKGIYILLAIGYEFVRFPLFLAKFLLSHGRPHPEWTLRQAVGVYIVSRALYHLAKVQAVTKLPLTPGSEKERFVKVKPAEGAQYVGPLRSNKDVQPVEIGATWYPAPLGTGSDKSNVKVILHIHGGGFVLGDGRTQATGYFAKKLLKHTPATHIFCPQYRISTLPASIASNPFPAALQDSLTSYLYLINDLKIPARNIIISGDSAGGNLSMSLLRYAEEFGPDLGISKPAATLLWSPWINPSDSSTAYVHENPHYGTDYLSPPFTVWASTAYAGLPGLSSLSHPYISHKDRAFKTSVPIYVNCGGAEVLYFDDKEWSEDMRKAGNDIEFYAEKTAPHDMLIMANLMGFSLEASNSAKKVGEWLKVKMM